MVVHREMMFGLPSIFHYAVLQVATVTNWQKDILMHS